MKYKMPSMFECCTNPVWIGKLLFLEVTDRDYFLFLKDNLDTIRHHLETSSPIWIAFRGWYAERVCYRQIGDSVFVQVDPEHA